MMRPGGAGLNLGRLARLTQKELRETLRDRRTVITLLLMPLLVYPILSLVFRTFLLTGVVAPPVDKPIVFRIAVDYRGPNEEFAPWFDELIEDMRALEEARIASIARYHEQREPPIARFVDHEFSERTVANEVDFVNTVVATGAADAGLIVRRVRRDLNRTSRNGDASRDAFHHVEVVVNPQIPASVLAAEYLRDCLDAVNRRRMQQRGALDQLSLLIDSTQVSAPQKTKPVVSFATLIPFILVLMTITGAVYPAIDLTAGERERGTMEALVAAPIPRMRILFAKFIAVLTVAMLTATLNLIGMMATIWAFGFEGLILQSGEFSLV
jgi:ABC-type Na+ efflux pump permease subunit